MLIALVGRDGFIEMAGPRSIVGIDPASGGSIVTLTDGRRLTTCDDLATLRRRLRAVGRSVPGRGRLLRRLWAADVWHYARTRLKSPLRRRTR